MSEVIEKRSPEVGEPWFTNLESRWLKTAEAEERELYWAQHELALQGDMAFVRSRKPPHRIEVIYVARLKNPGQGEDPLVEILGRSRPMKENEFGGHFSKQIARAVARRKQQN
jgi:hypothetical protein